MCAVFLDVLQGNWEQLCSGTEDGLDNQLSHLKNDGRDKIKL